MKDGGMKNQPSVWWNIIGALGEGLVGGGGWSQGLARGAQNLGQLADEREWERRRQDYVNQRKEAAARQGQRSASIRRPAPLTDAKRKELEAMRQARPASFLGRGRQEPSAAYAGPRISWGANVDPKQRSLAEATLMNLGRSK